MVSVMEEALASVIHYSLLAQREAWASMGPTVRVSSGHCISLRAWRKGPRWVRDETLFSFCDGKDGGLEVALVGVYGQFRVKNKDTYLRNRGFNSPQEYCDIMILLVEMFAVPSPTPKGAIYQLRPNNGKPQGCSFPDETCWQTLLIGSSDSSFHFSFLPVYSHHSSCWKARHLSSGPWEDLCFPDGKEV